MQDRFLVRFQKAQAFKLFEKFAKLCTFLILATYVPSESGTLFELIGPPADAQNGGFQTQIQSSTGQPFRSTQYDDLRHLAESTPRYSKRDKMQMHLFSNEGDFVMVVHLTSQTEQI